MSLADHRNNRKKTTVTICEKRYCPWKNSLEKSLNKWTTSPPSKQHQQSWEGESGIQSYHIIIFKMSSSPQKMQSVRKTREKEIKGKHHWECPDIGNAREKQKLTVINMLKELKEIIGKKREEIRRTLCEQVGNSYTDLEIIQKESNSNFWAEKYNRWN